MYCSATATVYYTDYYINCDDHSLECIANVVTCRRLVLRELNVAQKESCRSVYPSLTRLQCLTEMETIASLLFM